MKNTFLFSRDTIKKFGGLVITLANKSPRESVSWLLCITLHYCCKQRRCLELWGGGSHFPVLQSCHVYIVNTQNTVCWIGILCLSFRNQL